MADPATPITGEGIVAVIREDDRYLLIQRAHGIRAGGLWCFVGGAIEPGESQREALVREVREEVGLEVRPGEKVWECLSLYRDWILHCWTADPLDRVVRPDHREVADYRWLTVPEILAMPDLLPSVVEFFGVQGQL